MANRSVDAPQRLLPTATEELWERWYFSIAMQPTAQQIKHFAFKKQIFSLSLSLSLSLTHTHTHKYTNSAFSSWILFSIALALFQDFTLNQREDLFLILRNTRFHNRFYIRIVTSFKSTTRCHRCNSF